MRARNWLIVGAASLLLSGCQLFCPAPAVEYEVATVDTGCTWAAQIHLTRGEALSMSEELAEQILTHNEIGAKRCGWEANQSPPPTPAVETKKPP